MRHFEGMPEFSKNPCERTEACEFPRRLESSHRQVASRHHWRPCRPSAFRTARALIHRSPADEMVRDIHIQPDENPELSMPTTYRLARFRRGERFVVSFQMTTIRKDESCQNFLANCRCNKMRTDATYRKPRRRSLKTSNGLRSDTMRNAGRIVAESYGRSRNAWSRRRTLRIYETNDTGSGTDVTTPSLALPFVNEPSKLIGSDCRHNSAYD